MGLAWLAAACSSGSGGAATTTTTTTTVAGPATIKVTTTAFSPGGAVPVAITCEGDNAAPLISWTGIPSGTGQVAFVVEDPDAPRGTFVHWIVVGLTSAPAGSIGGGALPSGAIQLPGSSGQAAYVGPCPPDGDGAHHYHFEVFALRDAGPIRVPSGSAPNAVVGMLRDKALARGEVVGTFAR